jgi:UDP-N-acetylglucosamine 1-carboxyvinyltransferase
MSVYRVRGGNRLSGQIRVGGSKNAILPILAASVLHEGESVIHNCPKIEDTFVSIEILRHIGCKIRFEGNTLIIDASGINNHEIPTVLVSKMRSSVLFMGSMLGRLGKILINDPGGCAIGDRPVGLHLKALESLGAVITKKHGAMWAECPRLKGAKIYLDRVSVGATENAMLGAVAAPGETIIDNAACEPEICDLQDYLCALGADVSGAGTGTIVINGGKKLHNAEHSVIPDRIVAGTYLAAVAATGGSLTLTHVQPNDLRPVTARFIEMGCDVKETAATISIHAPFRLKKLSHVITEPHPGFPTDMQSQFTSALALAEGTSIISETIFESRNKHVPELKRMGADITVTPEGRNFVVIGRPALQGAIVEANDLRGGAALIIAGLAAEGETEVRNGHFIERGYESIDSDLRSVGGDIKLIA